MLQGLKVSNFKALRDVDVSFPRLTLLLGPNSSGKSSLFQIILAVKQTLESRNPLTPLVLNGRYVQLGSFENLVYSHDLAQRISIQVSIPTPRLKERFSRSSFRLRTRTLDPDISNEEPLELSTMSVGFSLDYLRSTRRMRLSESWVSDSEGREVVRVQQRKVTKLMGKDVSFNLVGKKLKVGGATFGFSSAYFLPNISSERFKSPKDPDANRLFRLETLLDYLRLEADSFFIRRVVYLGPLREYPKRYYIATGEMPREVGLKGENVVELLYYDSKSKRRQAGRIINRLKPWLETFGLAREVRIDALPEGLFSLTIRDPNTKLDVNLSDTGFGVSQVVPVVVECLSASAGTTVLVEQPEIHVHPRVQAELADLFISASADKKIVVETHSEHVLLRIQRRIAEGKISSDDVAIYYFNPSVNGTEVRRIHLDKSGSLQDWPPGFFEEDFQESLERSRVLAQKQGSVGNS